MFFFILSNINLVVIIILKISRTTEINNYDIIITVDYYLYRQLSYYRKHCSPAVDSLSCIPIFIIRLFQKTMFLF